MTTAEQAPTVQSNETDSVVRRNGRVSFYHANGQGTGTAVQFELRLNRPGEQRYGCFFMVMSKQKSVAQRNGSDTVHATFDWEHGVTVKLGFSDLCEFVAVLEGQKASPGSNGAGLYHQSAQGNTVVDLRKSQKGDGFMLAVSKKDGAGTQLFKGATCLGLAEAIGLRCVLQTGLFYVTCHGALG